MNPIGQVIELVLWIAIGLVLARFVIDWIQFFARDWQPHGPLLVLLEGVYTATDPPIRAVRRLLPPLRLGSTMVLDLSPMIVLLVCYLLLLLNRTIWF